MKKKGFTLAEVLITLVIIGIIGALTLPGLIQRTQKQEYVSALKKAYSTLSNATQQIIAEEGSPKSSCETCEDGWAHNVDSVYNLYKTKLNIVKDCGSNEGCFAQLGTAEDRGHKLLNGGYWTYNANVNPNYRKIIISDGMQIVFLRGSSLCSSSGFESSNICSWIDVDINGEKGPNTWGRDMFGFALTETGLQPEGCIIPYCKGTDGRGCGCKVLREGAMNY